MTDASNYTALIASEHADKPKFVAMVAAVAQCFADQQNALSSIPPSFDLDNAAGAQLDAVGLWVGVGRGINTPISGVYFSFDTVKLGFDQGVWQGPFDPSVGITSLDDDTYRLLIRARIGANRWDGTSDSSIEILQSIFGSQTQLFLQDNGDMSIVIGIVGTSPNALFLALLQGGYVPLRPSTVSVQYVMTSVPDAPIFGFDVENANISGLDVGALATTL
ncbi:DUF2612 domain-containing protein [Paraburkholderia sp. D15]|uniref:DUF2612 domain-containing protein n=1 Tax=Paraburkholderia sp. D15 TaxID=2880218 RepID=UPI002479CB2C|nr:DUF2612 domain-containing protein [Paraburkholderia sp. D15]WGS52663.1 DUF2612 domain-containing protein [Paraburkholderia sp. D15]